MEPRLTTSINSAVASAGGIILLDKSDFCQHFAFGSGGGAHLCRTLAGDVFARERVDYMVSVGCFVARCCEASVFYRTGDIANSHYRTVAEAYERIAYAMRPKERLYAVERIALDESR